ncbi:Nuclear export factor GLE1 (fragment) [Mesorhizobium metallidurans STM 2683]|uniref:Nuclear export factor GLE1 n=1 Tax=Mesorhizobium metallidurans STM 2683 TaxID=1297569 RepID=M5EM94_9HYPH
MPIEPADWSGGSLPDEFHDEFVFRGTLAADLTAGQKLYFPVVQECHGAADRWIDPAPGIKLLPKK